MRVAQLRVLGGAIARVDRDATAFAHRSSPIMVNLAAFYEPDAERPAKHGLGRGPARRDAPGRRRGVRQLPGWRGRGALPGRLSGAHLGPPDGDQGALRPANLFRRNQNIPPAAAGPS